MKRAVRAVGGRFVRRARGWHGSEGPIVLLYHRVARASIDPQLLCVSPERFAEHLGVLAESYAPLALGELLARMRAGKPANRCVAVTFDDGYADNLLTAEPLLERAGVPATVFVASGNVRDGRPFWWDELERVLLQPGELPSALTVTISGKQFHFELGDDAAYMPDATDRRAAWTVLDDDDPGPRQAAYRRLCSSLRNLDETEREAALAGLRSLVEPPNGPEPNVARPLTREELRRLVGEGFVDVGAHSVSHPVLARLASRRQEEEIAGSKRELEEIAGRPVSSFAYPYGGASDFDEAAVSLVRAAGFDHACTAVAGRLTPRTNPFRVPRLLVRDWTGEDFDRRLAEFEA
jgi:peptidoglycan/xylan/chitin deacetylase (PgdA/CDA1 family)